MQIYQTETELDGSGESTELCCIHATNNSMVDRKLHLREAGTHVLCRGHGLLRVERHSRKDGLLYTQVSPLEFLGTSC